MTATAIKRSAKTERVQIEVFILNDHNGWDTAQVWVPRNVAKSESQDTFIKWVYSDDGEAFRETWGSHVSAVFVYSFDFEEPDEDSEYVEKGMPVRVERPAPTGIPQIFGAPLGATGVMRDDGRIGEGAGEAVYDVLLDDGNEVSVYAHQLDALPETPARRAIRKLQQVNLKPRSYSGRGMYGKECVGVTLDEIDLGEATSAVGSKPHTDTMGRRTIAYWPSLEWPKGLYLDD